jgi:hypothetical protein
MLPSNHPAHADTLAIARQHAEAGRFADFRVPFGTPFFL